MQRHTLLASLIIVLHGFNSTFISKKKSTVVYNTHSLLTIAPYIFKKHLLQIPQPNLSTSVQC